MAKLLATFGLGLVLASTAATATPAGKPSTKPADNASAQKYCITFEPSTGTHLARTECRTKSEWRQVGVDVDELLQK